MNNSSDENPEFDGRFIWSVFVMTIFALVITDFPVLTLPLILIVTGILYLTWRDFV